MKRPLKVFLAFLVSGIFLILLYNLSQVLISQLFYLTGENAIENKQYELAVSRLKKAVRFSPMDSSNWEALGNAFRLSANNKPLNDAFPITISAKESFQKATSLNPLESSLFFSLASTEARLEQIALYTGKSFPSGALNTLYHFQKAIELAPNTAQYHFALAEYLYTENQPSALEKTIHDLGRVYPDAYHRITKEPFWLNNVRSAFKSGVINAIEHSSTAKSAHAILSDILEEENHYQEAIDHLIRSLELEPEIGAHDHIRLGKLYLAAGNIEKATQAFINALISSRNKAEALDSVYWIFEESGKLEAFLSVLKEAKAKKLLFTETNLYAARVHIKLKNFMPAKEILTSLSQQSPSGEAFYLLSEIAENEKDWDSMERFIQKATLHDSNNYWYHFKFSEVLERLKKINDAEKEADLAIAHSNESRSWLFNHRAWIRWQKEDYPGAFADWDQAANLDPKNPDYPDRAGDALYRMGRWEESGRYYQRALSLDPNKSELQKKYDALLKDLQRIRN